MDPSTPAAQDVQNQSQTTQQVRQTEQPKASPHQTQPVDSTQTQHQEPLTVSVNKEAGAAVITESQNAEEVVSPQEAKGQTVSTGAVEEEANVEIGPATPEFSASPEVEKVVEKSADTEKPDLSKAVQNAGVTHSGPGVIDVAQNDFGVKKLPVTYDQAVVEEKVTKLHDSKHWLSAMMMYIWRKINPKIGEKGGEKLKV